MRLCKCVFLVFSKKPFIQAFFGQYFYAATLALGVFMQKTQEKGVLLHTQEAARVCDV
jgi:hypothetical protein